MATPTRQSDKLSPKYTSPSFETHDDHESTSYNGAEGEMMRKSLQSLDGALGYDDLQVQSKPPPSPRQAMGARFLSTLSNAAPPGTGSALTRSKSLIHSRAKSLAQYVPNMNKESPTPAEKVSAPSPRPSSGFFGDFFSGESAPVRIGVNPATPETEDIPMEYHPTFTERPSARRKPTSKNNSPQKRASVAAGGRLEGWFGRKSTAVSSSISEDDELANININNALFPHCPVDHLAPHAFNDLLLNATELLQRMQTAYKEKVEYIASIQPEIDVQKEEVEEAETRARHLKMQLEDISRKKSEQETAMREMALQLADEKIKVQDARDALERAKRSSEETDNDATPRRQKRNSDGSANASDSGFESDMDYAESIMSQDTPTSHPAVTALRPDLSRSSSISGRSNARSAALERKWLGGNNDGATVKKLQEENKNLQKQMEIMHRQLQGCIDFVGGVSAV